jgi:hypothetical protein
MGAAVRRRAAYRPRPSGRGRLAVDSAVPRPGPRHPMASRAAARQPIAVPSKATETPAIVPPQAHYRSYASPRLAVNAGYSPPALSSHRSRSGTDVATIGISPTSP